MLIINLIFKPILNFFLRYPTPGSLSYLWNFGVSSLFFLVIQIITGLFLSMHYVPQELNAFESVEDIMRNISYGWLFRYMHSNGASFFFICVYAHIFRNIYFLSFLKPRQWVWYTGVVILILMIATAFTGYVLPWGQMSYWAATVITNLFSVIPYCGNTVVIWLWGDYGVTTSTLNRFYTIHFILPFIILIVACIHIFVLHKRGSTSKISLTIEGGKIMFHPFFTFKDLVFLIIILIVFLFVIGYAPNYLGHPDNYIPADPLVTPSHIVPEWYFLPFYAMLRCVPNKSLGVLVLACSLLQLFLLPSIYPNANTINSKVFTQDSNYYFVKKKDDEFTKIVFFGFRIYTILFWFFLINCIVLSILGSKPLESPYIEVSLFCTIFYFLFFYIGAFIFSEKGSKFLTFITSLFFFDKKWSSIFLLLSNKLYYFWKFCFNRHFFSDFWEIHVRQPYYRKYVYKKPKRNPGLDWVPRYLLKTKKQLREEEAAKKKAEEEAAKKKD